MTIFWGCTAQRPVPVSCKKATLSLTSKHYLLPKPWNALTTTTVLFYYPHWVMLRSIQRGYSIACALFVTVEHLPVWKGRCALTRERLFGRYKRCRARGPRSRLISCIHWRSMGRRGNLKYF